MMKSYSAEKDIFGGNSTIGIVAANATFTRAQAAKPASMAHNGYARTMRPVHSMFDGDTIFSMTTCMIEADLSVVGLLATRAMERAVIAAIKNTESLCGFKCYKDLKTDNKQKGHIYASFQVNLTWWESNLRILSYQRLRWLSPEMK